MSEPRTPDSVELHQQHGDGERHAHHAHGWMMIACCIPMIVIAVALVAAGVVSAGILLAVAACTGLMALMMWAMDHDQHHR